MLIAVNCTTPAAISVVLQLYKNQLIDFCELMVDNFIHIKSEQILQAFADMPLSLHIVKSRFLEKSVSDVEQLARYLRAWSQALKPLYISDHIVRFCDEKKT